MQVRCASFALLLSFGLFASSCVRSSSSGGASSTPVFLEAESNDTEFTANDFGFLRPGERFFIDGFIADDGSDPFDGFLFTAAEPVQVQFALFIDDGFADLDVCAFDPQLGTTVACFQSPTNPERGSVDVLFGGLDFHLVVESFAGASRYSLEIEVFRLNTLRASAEADGDVPGLRAENGTPPEADTLQGYREAPEPVAAEASPEVAPATLIVFDEGGHVVGQGELAVSEEGQLLPRQAAD